MKNSTLFFCVLFISQSLIAADVPTEAVTVLEGSTPAPAVVCEDPPSPLCSDLAKFTCAPGDYDDGTGVSRSGEARQDIVDQVKQSSRTRLQANYLSALRLPENSYFREAAKAATGLSAAPDCARPTPRCDEVLAQGLSQFSLKRLFPPPQMGGMIIGGYTPMGMPGASLKDIDFLLNDRTFLELERAESARIRAAVVDEDMNNKIKNDLFPEVQKQITNIINERITDPGVKSYLAMKISSIRFEGTDCGDMGGAFSPQDSSINSLLIPNAFYNPQTNTFKYCNGFLMTDRSEFKIISVIAHELGHSIDPCNIARGPSTVAFQYKGVDLEAKEGEYPFTGVISCLRSPQSVEARRPQVYVPMGQSPYPMPGGPFPGGPFPPTGGESGGGVGQPPAPMPTFPQNQSNTFGDAFCTGDQIGESYSDWLASEVLPRYMNAKHPNLSQDQFRNGYSNVFRGMCNNLEPAPIGMMGMDPHPPVPARINRIILAHPEVRRHMGCQSDSAPAPRYCGARP